MYKLLALIFCILTIAEYFSFYYIIFGKKLQITKKKAIGLFGAVLALAYWVWQEWVMDLRQGLLFVICMFMMYLLFQVSFWENIKLWIWAFTILLTLEGMIAYVLIAFFHLPQLYEMISYLLCILILLWGYYILVGKRLKREVFRLPNQSKVIALLIPVVLVLMMNYMIYALTEFPTDGPDKMGVLFVIAGSMAIVILLSALIYYFNVTQEYSMQAEILEEQNEQQREYFEELLKKEQDTRQFRHDLTAELLELENYCTKGEYDKLHIYLKEMLGSISEISKRQYDVGNDIVNTIINYYFLPIRDTSRILVKGYMQEEQAVSQRDLCILVSNLVKNAVEATAKIQEISREIIFEVQQGEKFLNIHLENSMEGQIKMKNGLPVTTKADKKNHGLGLINVMNIIKNNDGSYRCTIEHHRYIVDIFLNM